jgi:hypothetical protein
MIPDGFDCLSRILAVVKLEISTIAGPHSPKSARERVHSEDSVVDRGASSVLAADVFKIIGEISGHLARRALQSLGRGSNSVKGCLRLSSPA